MQNPLNVRRFEELMLPHSPMAHKMARRLLRNEDDAQDAVQEAYLRAVRFLDTFDGSNAQAWLLAIVRNTCLSFLRKRTASGSMTMFDERIHCARWSNAERALLDRENLLTLRRRIGSLPAALRKVLIMREFQQLTYQQIAQAARIPVGTVMSRLSRARNRLHRLSKDALPEPNSAGTALRIGVRFR
jgi:RNA polymerase sigma-70 factor (ECF subfamily)